MPPVRRRRSTTRKLSPQQIIEWARQFRQLQKQQKQLKKRQDDLKKELMVAVEEQGVEDDKGHIFYEFENPDEVDGLTALKREKRVAINLDEDAAEDVLKRLGLYRKCVRTIEVLDEDAIAELYYAKKISDKDYDEMFVHNTTYAFVPIDR